MQSVIPHEGVVLHLRHRDDRVGILETRTQCVAIEHGTATRHVVNLERGQIGIHELHVEFFQVV